MDPNPVGTINDAEEIFAITLGLRTSGVNNTFEIGDLLTPHIREDGILCICIYIYYASFAERLPNFSDATQNSQGFIFLYLHIKTILLTSCTFLAM